MPVGTKPAMWLGVTSTQHHNEITLNTAMNVSLYWDHHLPRFPANGSSIRLPEWQSTFTNDARRILAELEKKRDLSGRFWTVIAVSALLHSTAWLLWQMPSVSLVEPRTMHSFDVALIAPQPEAPAAPQVPVLTPPAPPEVIPKPKPIVQAQKRPVVTRVEQPQQQVQPTAQVTNTAPMPVVPFVEANYRAAYLNNPSPKYPMAAKERHWEGMVVLKVEVLSDGSSGSVNIDQSSGHEVLDEAAVEAARHWRFVAAKRGDDAVASWVLIPIEFKLKR